MKTELKKLLLFAVLNYSGHICFFLCLLSILAFTNDVPPGTENNHSDSSGWGVGLALSASVLYLTSRKLRNAVCVQSNVITKVSL